MPRVVSSEMLDETSRFETSLPAAIERVGRSERVWVRAAATADNSGAWRARLLELTAGAEPPGWVESRWSYPAASFEASQQSGQTVAEWLTAALVPINQRQVRLSDLGTSVLWQRRQSRSEGQYEPVEWPNLEAELTFPGVSFAEPSGTMISAEDAPSFVSFYNAAVAFFWPGHQPRGGQLPRGVIFREQDVRGRIDRVRVTSDALDVFTSGSRVDGMTVELAGEAPGTLHVLADTEGSGSATTSFQLAGGLPAGAWVLLRRGAEWIDQRFLTPPWSHGADAGVEVISDPQSKLEIFLANREGPQVEFKREVPTDDESKKGVMKTVCAFANGAGGSILFGITNDHEVVGLPTAALDRVKDQLTQMVRSWVQPPPRVDFDVIPIDGIPEMAVLELAISPGSSLHGCAKGPEPGRPYIRNYAISVPATPREIEAIVTSRTVTSYPMNPLSAHGS
jgi:hypothetical protein